MSSPRVVLHRACRNSGSSFLVLRFGKLLIFQEDMSELQLQRSSHTYRIGSLQIYQNDWHLQLQKDVDLAHRKQLLYTVPSYGCRTSAAVSGRDSPLLEYSRLFARLQMTHIYLIESKPRGKVVKDSWLMEVCQLGHVINPCWWCF